MRQTMTQWVAGVTTAKTRIAIPILTNPGIELCGCTINEAVTNGKIHAAAIRRLNEIYPAAASTVIMDLTVEAEAFGAEINFPENEVPTVTGRLVTNLEEVEALPVPGLQAGRVQEYLTANRLTAQTIVDKPVFAGCIGPFSLAGRLFGMTEIMMALYTEPQTVTLLLEKCAAFIANYCQAIKETGVNGVIIAEPAAGLISNKDCLTYSSNYIQPMVEALQDESFLVVLHNCGNTGHCTQAMVASGVGALHFGNKIDMLKALADTPTNRLVMGNIDPVGILKMASPEIVKASVSVLLNATAGYPNYVLSTGCDVPPGVPFENIEAFYQALNEYNTQQ